MFLWKMHAFEGVNIFRTYILDNDAMRSEANPNNEKPKQIAHEKFHRVFDIIVLSTSLFWC